MIEINSNSQLAEMLKKRKVILMYGATWCGVCNKSKPIMEKLSKKYPGVPICYIDVEEMRAVIHFLPTYRFMYNGKEIKRYEGDIISKLEILVKKFNEDTKKK